MRRFSSTLRNGNTSRPSGTWPMPNRATLSGSKAVMSTPSKVTLPFCASMAALMVFSTVVLPAPLAPRMVTMWDWSTLSDTPRMAMIGP